MLLKAVQAFWLPMAYQELGGKKAQDLKKISQSMIFILEEQANYLRVIFGIERSISTEQSHSVTITPTAWLPKTQESVCDEQESPQEEPFDGWAAMAAREIDTGGL